MGKSTHTWFLAGVSPCVTLPKRISVSVLCLKILCLIIIIIIHLNQGCRGMRISGGWRFFDLPHAHATDDTKREVQGWSISNSFATHPPKENSTPRSSRVHAFPPLIGSRSSSVSVLNRGLCDCSLVCVCMFVCVSERNIYCTNSTRGLMRGSLIDFYSTRRVGDVSMRLIYTLPPSQLQWVSFFLMIGHFGAEIRISPYQNGNIENMEQAWVLMGNKCGREFWSWESALGGGNLTFRKEFHNRGDSSEKKDGYF